jgi:hypothetical protein
LEDALRFAPEKVFAALAAHAGRARYWAESAPEANGTITFHILNYELFAGRVPGKRKPSLFKLEYFGTIVEFSLRSDEKGGTDLSLMAMKAAVDHGVDLRNHDASRAWGNGYADN